MGGRRKQTDPTTRQLPLQLADCVYGAENIAPLFGKHDARWLRRHKEELPVTKLPGGVYAALLTDVRQYIHDRAMANLHGKKKKKAS